MKKNKLTKNIAIITARKNSKRIKNKNIKIFNKKPLIYWTIKTALKSKLFDKVFVSKTQKKLKIFRKKLELKFYIQDQKIFQEIMQNRRCCKF